MNAYIVEATRLPIGKRGGGLSSAHPVDLGVAVLQSLVALSGVDPERVDDVIFGCLDPVGGQGGNIARQSWLSAGLPESVPGTTIDRACGSSQQAISFAAQAIRAGDADLVVAAGVQCMTRIPMGSAITMGKDAGFGGYMEDDGWIARYGNQPVNQFLGAERIAAKWDFDRQTMDEYALQSHQRAARAWTEGRFDREVTPFGAVTVDEGFRADAGLAAMSALKTIAPEGRLTAALASQISDGAAGVLVASESAVESLGLVPRALVRAQTVVGSDPILMLTGPIEATRRALDRAGLTVADIDLFECNEAFAPVVLAWAQELDIPLEKVNVNGGAIALGHPLGSSGARLMTTLVHELERTGGRFGLQTMCEGGGMANATIIERL